MAVRVGTWLIRLMSSDENMEAWENEEFNDDFYAVVNEMEHTLTELVPEGYYVKIEYNGR
jgi:hypothetical protein